MYTILLQTFMFLYALLSSAHRHFQNSCFCISPLKLVLRLSVKVENEVKQEVPSQWKARCRVIEGEGEAMEEHNYFEIRIAKGIVFPLSPVILQNKELAYWNRMDMIAAAISFLVLE